MNCKCGADLTNVKVTNGVSKTNGKAWSAKFCPSCKEANWIKSTPVETVKKIFNAKESVTQDQSIAVQQLTATKEGNLILGEILKALKKQDTSWKDEEENS